MDFSIKPRRALSVATHALGVAGPHTGLPRPPRYREPAAAPRRSACGITIEFDAAPPRRGAGAARRHPPLPHFRRARRRRDHRRFLWDRVFLARTHLPVPRSTGSSSGLTPTKASGSSNSRMGPATPSSTGACWLRAASTSCNRVKPSKSASGRDTRDHTSPRSSASIEALLSRRHHADRISGRRHQTGHLRALPSRRPAQ